MTNMNLEDAKKDFINYCVFEKGLSDKTKESYENDLKVYLSFLKKRGVKQVNKISSDDIKEFLKERSEDATTTVAHNLTVIKNFHSYLLREKIVDKDISEFIDRPKLKKALPKALSVEDIDKLLDIELNSAFDYRNKAMLELMYGCGLRVSELIDIELNDVDMYNCLIRIYGKGNKERDVPVGEYAIHFLQLYLDRRNELIKGENPSKLFLNNHGKQMTRQGFFKNLKKLLKEKGLNPNVSPHTLRHSFATHLINRGADLRSIQEMLGHADISTTKIYTKVSDDKVLDDYLEYHMRSTK